MQTIALISQKGGAGKTTVALHLATAFWLAGEATVVLDLDPQRSATTWFAMRGPDSMPEVMTVRPDRLLAVVQRAREISTGALICDTAPHSEATAVEVARHADLILVPCQPSMLDLWAMSQTADLLRNVGKPAIALLNNVPSFGALGDDAETMIGSNLGLPVCPVRLGARVAYRQCMITGQVAQEVEPKGKAAAEMGLLHAWVRAKLAMPA